MDESSSPKRILALDGGGIRGVFTIEVLARIESLLREHYHRPQLVLADHFHLMAGTSTGAIIATLLSWGEPVDNVRKLYQERCETIFPRPAPWRIWKFPRLAQRLARAIYGAEALSEFLKDYFRETNGEPATLGTDRLKTLLLLCMRNATTGSAWPVTNNRKALYNQADHPDCNLNIPLWKLVRASTAAPIYFMPEEIEVGKSSFAFIDGGITPFNNPALVAFLTATLPCYRVEWPAGPDKLRLVSIGTGRVRSVLKNLSFRALNIGSSLMQLPSGLMDGINVQQDFMCRVLGSCLYGDEIDSEVGSLLATEVECAHPEKKFTYVRYDHRFSAEELIGAARKYGQLTLDNLRTMSYLSQLGTDYAAKNVKLEHIL